MCKCVIGNMEVDDGSRRSLSEPKNVNVCTLVTILHFNVVFNSSAFDLLIQLPGSSIWGLLILAEVLGVDAVHHECMNRLDKLFAYNSSIGERCLPSSISGVFRPADLPEVERNLRQHFDRFHPKQQQSTNRPDHRDSNTSDTAKSQNEDQYLETGRVQSGAYTARLGQEQAPLHRAYEHSDCSSSVRSGRSGCSRYGPDSSSASSGTRSVQTDVGYDSDTVGDDELAGWRHLDRRNMADIVRYV